MPFASCAGLACMHNIPNGMWWSRIEPTVTTPPNDIKANCKGTMAGIWQLYDRSSPSLSQQHHVAFRTCPDISTTFRRCHQRLLTLQHLLILSNWIKNPFVAVYIQWLLILKSWGATAGVGDGVRAFLHAEPSGACSESKVLLKWRSSHDDEKEL